MINQLKIFQLYDSLSVCVCVDVFVCSASAAVMSSESAWTYLCACTNRRNMLHGLLGRMSDHIQKMINLNFTQAPDLGLTLSVCLAAS